MNTPRLRLTAYHEREVIYILLRLRKPWRWFCADKPEGFVAGVEWEAQNCWIWSTSVPSALPRWTHNEVMDVEKRLHSSWQSPTGPVRSSLKVDRFWWGEVSPIPAEEPVFESFDSVRAARKARPDSPAI